mmetsp:Transcript_12903/g.21607  ORF Transcript_12903/g.21607 Transcript_12903/m.21607 type:complete len:502 (-) Transcript_12903:312-1817(-)
MRVLVFLTATLVAVSGQVPKKVSDKIEQIALNYGDSPQSMVITFASFSTEENTATCLFGTSEDQLDQSTTATGSQYKLDDYTSPMLFKCTLTGLVEGNKKYYYQVGSEALGFSHIYPFKSHPGVGVDDVTFHVYGDIGQTDNSATTLQELHVNEQLLKRSLSGGIVSAGDLSYANGDEPRWDTFGQLRQNLSAFVPTMTTLGNHEWFDDDEYAFTAYLARFDNPPAATTGQRELYYSYDAGLVHWVMVAGYCSEMRSTSTQPCLAEGSPQMKWLQADLAGVDRALTPWVVVVFHQPYMNSNTAHDIPSEGRPMQQAIEDTLYENGVDLVFSGHVHAYERTCAAYQYTCYADGSAPYYITIGDGGNHEGLASDWVNPQPQWSLFRQASYGFGELHVKDAHTMTWRWHQNEDLAPVVADEFTFTKSSQRQKPSDQQQRSSGSNSKNLRRGDERTSQQQQQQQQQQQHVTGVPVFADNARGRRASVFNEERSRLYTKERRSAGK